MAVRWLTAPLPVRLRGLSLDLVALDGFEANVAHDVARRRGRPDPRPGAEIAPMFGVLWPGARAIAQRLLDGPSLAEVDVLELGCGLALPSLVAAHRGARVVATDVHPDAGPLLTHNAARLDLDVTWAAWDWRAAPPQEAARRFPRVIASDVLYDGALAEPLAAAFAARLAPGGTGWLTDPGRPWLAEFADAARAAGLSVVEDVVAVPTDDAVDEVFWLTLTAPGGPTPR